MKGLIACTALLLAAAWVFAQPPGRPTQTVEVNNSTNNPVLVSDRTITEWRYIGLTQFEDTGQFEFGGLNGVAAMNKVCAAEFGPGARAANIREAHFRDDEAQDARSGWLAPGEPMIVAGEGLFYTMDAATGAYINAYGLPVEETAVERAYCDRYQAANPASTGPLVDSNGVVGWTLCGQTLPVACSAPVSIPVRTP